MRATNDRAAATNVIAPAIASLFLAAAACGASHDTAADAAGRDSTTASGVTELSIQVVTDGKTATIYLQEPARPDCTCSAGNLPTRSQCASNNDGIQCFCEPPPAACITRVDAYRDGAVVAQIWPDTNYSQWVGELYIQDELGIDALTLDGCGATAHIDFDGAVYSQPTITDTYKTSWRTLVVEWTSMPMAPDVMTSQMTLSSTTCIPPNTGRAEFDVANSTTWYFGIRPVVSMTQQTALGTATLWYGAAAQFVWKEARLTLAPVSHDFRAVAMGAASVAFAFTASNRGSKVSTTLTTSIEGAHPSDFAIDSDTCDGNALAPGAECSVSLTFAPTAPGARRATLRVDGGDDGVRTSTVRGLGVEATTRSLPGASQHHHSAVTENQTQSRL